MLIIIFMLNILLSQQTNYTIYITPLQSSCSCDQPIITIMQCDSIFRCLNLIPQSQNLTLILVPNSISDHNHYVMTTEYTNNIPNSIYYNYSNTTIFTINFLTIKPLFSNDSNPLNFPTLTNTQSITLYIKTLLTINVIGELNIQNIIFDGSEDLYTINRITQSGNSLTLSNTQSNGNLSTCIYSRIRCCNQYNSINGSSLLYPDVLCARPDILYSKMIALFINQTTSALFDLSYSMIVSNSAITNFYMPYTAFFNINSLEGNNFVIQDSNMTKNFVRDTVVQASQYTSISFINSYFNNLADRVNFTTCDFNQTDRQFNLLLQAQQGIVPTSTIYLNSEIPILILNCTFATNNFLGMIKIFNLQANFINLTIQNSLIFGVNSIENVCKINETTKQIFTI